MIFWAAIGGFLWGCLCGQVSYRVASYTRLRGYLSTVGAEYGVKPRWTETNDALAKRCAVAVVARAISDVQRSLATTLDAHETDETLN